MTQQYLVRQMSQLLSDLNAVARDHGVALEVVHLRREAETTPPSALTSIVTRALGLAERLCWDSLDGGRRRILRAGLIFARSCGSSQCARGCSKTVRGDSRALPISCVSSIPAAGAPLEPRRPQALCSFLRDTSAPMHSAPHTPVSRQDAGRDYDMARND